ncbi:MAG TPA: phosphoenolpyruvate-utilizing N-terminal domain-containing protein, partial [Planctomycetota bacterium]|nr:phosphoenolpyruvate-utilizing N-terminal domain-containing protein [Planctomycetota bacterium]
MDPADAASDPWLRSRARRGRFLRQTRILDWPTTLVRTREGGGPGGCRSLGAHEPALRASTGRGVVGPSDFRTGPAAQYGAPMVHRARIIHGTAVSPGLAVGPVHVARSASQAVPTWSVPEEDLEREVARLHGAIRSASDELVRRQRMVALQAGEKDAEIFAVHRMVLQDPGALRQVESVVRDQRVNAESGVQALIQRLQASLSKLEGDSVRAYAADISDPWRVVLDTLQEVERADVQSSAGNVVLAAAELTPQVLMFIERGRLLAVIAETGGRFSHAAVLARAFGVPCVVGLPGLIGRIERGMIVAVDGDRGTVQLAPSTQDKGAF